MLHTRRKFIQYSAFSAAAFALNPLCSRPIPITNRKLGVALVGLGGYSTGQLAPALQLTEHCELRGIVTGSPAKIPTWQKRYDIKDSNVYNYETMHEIADNDEIDVIYIVVPTGLHAKYATIAANTGKHLWCEKPMAMNVAECQEIIDACNKNKVTLSLGYRVQHEPNTQTLNGYAKTKPYGEMERIEAMAGYRGGGGSGWRFQRDMGGGALYDMGVYTVNGIRLGSGLEPIAVQSARQFAQRPNLFKEVDETTEYILEMSNGILAHGRTSVGENINKLRVDCTNGWYELSPMQTYDGVQGRTSDGTLLNQRIQNQQARQMDHDALAILEDEAVLMPGEVGLADIRVIEAIIESARTGERVVI